MATVQAKPVSEAPAPRSMAIQSASPDIEVGFTKSFDLIWNDQGSGGKYDGAFWRPKPPAGFYALGSYGRQGYAAPTDDVVMVVRDRSPDPNRPALKAPKSFTLVWKDSGSGASMDGSFWKPEPPDGYQAMGLVCNRGHGPPNPNDVRCVRTDLTVVALPGDHLWNDVGTGAKANFGAWTIKAPSDAPPGEAYINPGTFFGEATHTMPTFHPLLRALRVRLPEAVVQPPTTVFPRLMSFASPSPYEAPSATYETQLPFIFVKDDQYTDAQKLVLSPFYTLRRTDRYACLNHGYNQGSFPQQRVWRHVITKEKNTAETFTNTAGIAIKVGVEGQAGPVKLSAEVTLMYQFSYEKTASITVGDSIEWEVPITIPPGKAVAAWYVESEYVLFRQDGTQVSGARMVRSQPDSVVFDEYPHEPNAAPAPPAPSTPAPPGPPSALPGQTMAQDKILKSGTATDKLTSPNAKYKLVMQTDGNLVVYDGTRPIWASNTNGKGVGPYQATMQDDGNLVVYDSTRKPLWASNTYRKGVAPYRAVMQDDGNFVVYAGATATWSSKSGLR